MFFEYLHVVTPVIGLMLNVIIQVCGFRYILNLTLLKSVMVGFVSGFLSVVGVEWYLGVVTPASVKVLLAHLTVSLLIYSALGYCYFHFINLGETARRIRILRELYEAQDGLSLEEILERYNAQSIVALRIQRLVHNGQIRAQQNRYVIGSPVMVFIAKSMTLLKRCILGKTNEFDE